MIPADTIRYHAHLKSNGEVFLFLYTKETQSRLLRHMYRQLAADTSWSLDDWITLAEAMTEHEGV